MGVGLGIAQTGVGTGQTGLGGSLGTGSTGHTGFGSGLGLTGQTGFGSGLGPGQKFGGAPSFAGNAHLSNLCTTFW